MEVLGRLLALLAILLAGTDLRTTGILDETRTARLNADAYYVALPALIFVSTYDQSIAELELGGDTEFASLNVFATTLVSIGTLFVLIALVS